MSSTSNIITKKYSVNGIKINVAQTGTGQPLVLIHGWCNNWIGWTLLANRLKHRYKLYMLDLPGFGDSDRLKSYTIDQEAQYINAFITKNKIKPKAIIGASLGTLISAYTLEKYPHLTDNLIELGAYFNNQNNLEITSKIFIKTLKLAGKTWPTRKALGRTIKSRYTAYLVEKFLNAYKFDRKKVDKYGMPGRRKITGKSYIQLGISASKFSLSKYLIKTQAQVLLIYGEAEKYTNLVDVENFVKSGKALNVRLTIIKKCGHNPAYEQPGQTAKSIINFLENTNRRTKKY